MTQTKKQYTGRNIYHTSLKEELGRKETSTYVLLVYEQLLTDNKSKELMSEKLRKEEIVEVLHRNNIKVKTLTNHVSLGQNKFEISICPNPSIVISQS